MTASIALLFFDSAHQSTRSLYISAVVSSLGSPLSAPLNHLAKFRTRLILRPLSSDCTQGRQYVDTDRGPTDYTIWGILYRYGHSNWEYEGLDPRERWQRIKNNDWVDYWCFISSYVGRPCYSNVNHGQLCCCLWLNYFQISVFGIL